MGRSVFRAALFATFGAGTLAPTTVQADGAAVIGPQGAVLARIIDADFCLHWSHSVTGGAVADCFSAVSGKLVLRRSYLHDFAAGLGHIPGRGEQRSAEGGGYWIEGIDAPVPGNALALRVGGPKVGHTILAGAQEIALGALAPGQRVMIVPWPATGD